VKKKSKIILRREEEVVAVAAVVIARLRLRLRRGSRWMTTKAMAKLSRR
jgi:hypothetical protein